MNSYHLLLFVSGLQRTQLIQNSNQSNITFVLVSFLYVLFVLGFFYIITRILFDARVVENKICFVLLGKITIYEMNIFEVKEFRIAKLSDFLNPFKLFLPNNPFNKTQYFFISNGRFSCVFSSSSSSLLIEKLNFQGK